MLIVYTPHVGMTHRVILCNLQITQSRCNIRVFFLHFWRENLYSESNESKYALSTANPPDLSICTCGAHLKRIYRVFQKQLYNIYKYVFRAVGCFPGPYLANSFYRSTHNAKHYSSLLFRMGGNQFIHSDGCSSHSNRVCSMSKKKKAYSLAEQCLLIIC